jgi:hypothetical protein
MISVGVILSLQRFNIRVPFPRDCLARILLLLLGNGQEGIHFMELSFNLGMTRKQLFFQLIRSIDRKPSPLRELGFSRAEFNRVSRKVGLEAPIS